MGSNAAGLCQPLPEHRGRKARRASRAFFTSMFFDLSEA
jgi:hypothetical protein